jgi:hypothetical protein
MSLRQLRQRSAYVTREAVEYTETLLFIFAWAASLVRPEHHVEAR